jgi:hydrogenase expression/formation protein HypE
MSAPHLFARKLDLLHGRVDMTHGGGGRAMVQLVSELFAAELDNAFLSQGNDMAVMPHMPGRIVMSTDAYVVSPLFFPGGDIGSLAAHGTINDVAMSGGRPLYLSAAFIIEEGFPLADLARIVRSMAASCREAGVPVVAGDTKVVERGKADGVFIVTTGVGNLAEGLSLSGDRIRPGDAILLSGSIGDHGIAILSRRENLEFGTPIVSDSAALHGLVAAMIACTPGLRCLRDPTRGGLAATLNELAHQSGVGLSIMEDAVPIKQAVRGACELLGIDPFGVANEGKLLAFCPADQAHRLLACMHEHPLGHDAAIIGFATEDTRQFVRLRTTIGSERIIDWLNAEQLPRIC